MNKEIGVTYGETASVTGGVDVDLAKISSTVGATKSISGKISATTKYTVNKSKGRYVYLRATITLKICKIKRVYSNGSTKTYTLTAPMKNSLSFGLAYSN